MPGRAWSIPADECNVGSRLRDVEGSTCNGCYALKGRYAFKTVKTAMYRRLDVMSSDPMRWAESMAAVINRRSKREKYFRWHDSGDLQSAEHLDAIISVAELTPDVQHWLPTREYELVKNREFPPNLNVRVSAHMVDGNPPDLDLPTSTVHDKTDPAGHECPAPNQGNQCGDCRACWDPNVANVSYRVH